MFYVLCSGFWWSFLFSHRSIIISDHQSLLRSSHSHLLLSSHPKEPMALLERTNVHLNVTTTRLCTMYLDTAARSIYRWLPGGARTVLLLNILQARKLASAKCNGTTNNSTKYNFKNCTHYYYCLYNYNYNYNYNYTIPTLPQLFARSINKI